MLVDPTLAGRAARRLKKKHRARLPGLGVDESAAVCAIPAIACEMAGIRH